MALRINNIAPGLTLRTIQGVLCFHEWSGDSYAIVFYHPKDIMPVDTIDLGCMA